MSSSSVSKPSPTSNTSPKSDAAPPPAPFFDGGEDFEWHKYLAHRPTYTPDFYDIIWSYHEKNSGHWQFAHDIGTGPGNVAEVLATRFTKVIASDPSADNVARARKRLNHSNIVFERCRGEDLADLGGSDWEDRADLIAAAECLSLMDVEKAFAGFAKMLRPGGTLATWFYGKPIFAGPGQEKSQELYDMASNKAWERIKPIKGTPMQRAFTDLAAWLDNIAFPSTDWTDVKRIKWNNDKPLSFLDEECFDFKADYKSAIGPDEELVENLDRSFWAKENCGMEWVEGFIDVHFPWKKGDDDIDAQLKPIFEDLEVAMGGKGSKVTIAWPVVLLLATRK